MKPSSGFWWFFHQDAAWQFGFTDARSDVGNRDLGRDIAVARTPHEQLQYLRKSLGSALDKDEIVFMNQVHGNEVALAQAGEVESVDALIVEQSGLAALVRVADCVPIVIGAPGLPLVAVVHAGRVGMASGVVSRTCEELRTRGASSLTAWIGPRACGSCYEVPDSMRDEIARAEPAAFSNTSWGTPALDIGAGVKAQLARAGVTIHDVGIDACTIENEAFWSHRRQGSAAGRFGAIAALTAQEQI